MDINNFKGKKIKEIMNEDTMVCNKDNLVDNWTDTVIGYMNNAGTIDDDVVLYDDYYVFVLNNGKLKAVFHVYEIHSVILNKKRGLMIVEGHETIHQYWFDDGEYSEEHTR
jgi:hypothetical protein